VPKPKKGARLGSNPAHQKLLLSTLAKQLFLNEAINTTEAKAKMLRPYAEKLITFAKRGDLAARREVLKDIPDRDIVARSSDTIQLGGGSVDVGAYAGQPCAPSSGQLFLVQSTPKVVAAE